jgi:hypothetical protein
MHLRDGLPSIQLNFISNTFHLEKALIAPTEFYTEKDLALSM